MFMLYLGIALSLIGIYLMTPPKILTKKVAKVHCKHCKHSEEFSLWMGQDYYCTNEDCDMARRRRRSKRQQMNTNTTQVTPKKTSITIPESWDIDVEASGTVFYTFEGTPTTYIEGEEPKLAIGKYTPREVTT